MTLCSIMFKKALDMYGDRLDNSAQVVSILTRMKLAHAMLGLNEQVAEDEQRSNELLQRLTKRYKRAITLENLGELIPIWSK